VSVVHHDTDNLHIHLAINKVHPRKLTLHEPFQSYRTLGKVCARLERELGLRVDNHTARRTIGEGRAADMELHAGVESLMTWVRRECLGELQQARSWAELHEVLHAHGLRINERGAGLSIEAEDGTRVKASTVDRGLSKAALEARLGAFQAADGGRKTTARKTYAKRPTSSRVDTSALFERYQREREGLSDSRAAALAAAKRAKDRAVEDARRAYKLHTAMLRVVDGRGVDKRLLFAQASRQLKARLQAIHEDYGRVRQRILAGHQRRTWADWLKAEAIEADRDALAALRARAAAENLRGATVRGEGATASADAAPDIDTVTKAGTVVYRAGASAVRDDGQRLQVSREADQEAIRTALRLARQQYGDRISVNGSAAFRAAVVRAAVDMDLPITFTDPGLERHRQALLRKERPDGNPTHAAARRGQTAQPGPGGLHGLRPGDAAAGHTRGPVRAKPHPGGHPRQPPPASRHGLRNLSAVDVDGQRQGREGVLPRDVRGGVEHQGTQRPDPLRRTVHRSGRGQVGQAPSVARQRASGAGTARKPSVGKAPPPQARACAQAVQPPQPGAGKAPVAAVGRKPPPAARVRVRPLSALDAGPLGRGNPARPPAAPPWQIPGAIFSPAAYAAADAYIAEREAKRARGLDVPRHARYTAGAGPLTYAGTRNVDGQALALLKRGDDVLVMPIDPVTAQRLSRTARGTLARVNANASISTGTGRGRSR
jgi:hypothetical protein